MNHPLTPPVLVLIIGVLAAIIYTMWPLLTMLRIGPLWPRSERSSGHGHAQAPTAQPETPVQHPEVVPFGSGYRSASWRMAPEQRFPAASGDPLPNFTHFEFSVANSPYSQLASTMQTLFIRLAGKTFCVPATWPRKRIVDELTQMMHAAMDHAVAQEDYEAAARYRDAIASIETTITAELAKYIKE